MAYSSRERHNPVTGCVIELGFTPDGTNGYPTPVVSAVGRGCLDPYTEKIGGKSHSASASGYPAQYMLGALGSFQETHKYVEVVPEPSLNRVAPELGALMATQVQADAEFALDQMDGGLRDAEVAAAFDTAADQIMPRFDEA
jgi:hypothetical protein